MQINKNKFSLKLNLKNIKRFLRVDHDFDDDLLNLYILSAEEFAKHHLGDQFDELKNNPLIKAALISHVRYLYEEEYDFEIIENIIQIYSKYIKQKLH